MRAPRVIFIGPSGDVMRALGDKIAAKLLAEKVGVPVARWSGGPVETDEEALAHAAEIGYPLMIKAAAGGGGRGIRIVTSDAELLPSLERARDEGRRAFGDGSVLMERIVTGASHVVGRSSPTRTATGWAAACATARCSGAARSDRGVVSPVLPADERPSCADRRRPGAGSRLLGAAQRRVPPPSPDRDLAFLEVNTRLQVEHPVTEETTGLDLVKLQIHVAEGGRLEGEPPPARGHAIEARVNAEDPERGFAPAPGRVEMLVLPTGPGIRVDTGVSEGDDIPPEYDSMIAKVIAWGHDRDEARARRGRSPSSPSSSREVRPTAPS